MRSTADEITELKRHHNAVVLAHYYQRPEIQDVADAVGDSLQLALAAQQSKAKVIVLAGVRFMAETAKLLNPSSIVLAPTLEASCSLVEQSPPDAYRDFLAAHADHTVVSYVNSGLEVKAMSDVVCTSANAERVIAALPANRPVVFGPDRHLGAWLQQRTGRPMVLWNAECEVHAAFDAQQLDTLRNAHPTALVLAHPECPSPVLERADVIGSTSALLSYVVDHPHGTFIVATEVGILHRIRNHAPLATLIPAPPIQATECACSACPYMKMNTLDALLESLRTLTPRIEIDAELARRAVRPIHRMFELV
jgi:quinolinate synthase